MTNPWFKFYGAEYLSDPKLLGMNANVRSCWLTLLCYASISDEPGVVRYLTEEQLIIQAGVPLAGKDFEDTVGVLGRFAERGMIRLTDGVITVLNWQKRQESYLSNAERQARYRDRNASYNTDVTEVTLEKNREEKKRIEKKPHAAMEYLTKIPDSHVKELSEKYEASIGQIRRKAETMKNYCLAKGKVYKNYRAFLENGLDKDFGRRRLVSAPVVEKVTLTPEQQKRVDAKKKEIGDLFRVKQPL